MRLLKSYSISLLIICYTFTACEEKSEVDNEIAGSEIEVRDLEEVKAGGKLKAIIDNSSTSYFIYKGQPMGFEYELLSRFAKEIDVELEVINLDDLGGMIDALMENQGDVIAANLTITNDRRKWMEFSRPILKTHQVLVQRQLQAKDIQKGKLLVESPVELSNKKVYVQKASSFNDRLKNLSDEIGANIKIEEVSGDITVEQLIEKVAEGEIDYTVADEHVAKINKAFYRNIHIKTPLSLEQEVAWAARKESPKLLIAINNWLKDFKKTTDFRVIYLKYYGNTKLFRNRVNDQFFTSKSGKLSQYDPVVKEAAEKIGWDWRLLSSLIYQESRFNPNASSWAGAQGLMQLMPTTSAEYGLDSSAGPTQNIYAGVKYIDWIQDQFDEKVQDSLERRKFVIASYNVGLGHVFDAIRLAEKHGLDTQKWNGNVAEMLLKKSDPDYYQDSVVHYGYCRGKEPYKYVNQIYQRYHDYLNVTKEEKEVASLN